MRNVALSFLCVFFAVAATACGDRSTALIAPGAPQFQTGDQPCPPNNSGHVSCRLATGSEIQQMTAEAEKISGQGQCAGLPSAALSALSSEVWIVTEQDYTVATPGDGSIQWTGSEPPYDPVRLFVGSFFMMDGHIQAGNLRNMLAHEGAHLLGYKDDDGGAQGLADQCAPREAEKEEYDEVDEEEQDMEPEEGPYEEEGGSGFTNCVVRVWYWKDTGEVISTHVLYCY